jgi:hypothetical protein
MNTNSDTMATPMPQVTRPVWATPKNCSRLLKKRPNRIGCKMTATV